MTPEEIAALKSEAWGEGYTFGRLQQFEADLALQPNLSDGNSWTMLEGWLEYSKGKFPDNPHREVK